VQSLSGTLSGQATGLEGFLDVEMKDVPCQKACNGNSTLIDLPSTV
jgi:hypothetical protein